MRDIFPLIPVSKKILRGGIFKHGVLEPLDIELEGLDSLFHHCSPETELSSKRYNAQIEWGA